MGYFSSDRSIREYCRDIWNATPVHVTAPSHESGVREALRLGVAAGKGR